MTCAFMDEDDDVGFDGIIDPKQTQAPKKSLDLKQIADSGPADVNWAAGLTGGIGFKSEVIKTN